MFKYWNKLMDFGYVGLLKAMLDYKELRNYQALLTADLLCCTEDMLKETDNFENNVFGFDYLKKTVQHWKKYPVSKRRGFIGRVTLNLQWVTAMCRHLGG